MKILPAILWFFLILPEAVGQTQLRFVTWRPEAAAVWQSSSPASKPAIRGSKLSAKSAPILPLNSTIW